MTPPQSKRDLSPTDRFFSENLLNLRTSAGLSQEGLAEKMRELGFEKYSQMTVSRIEKGLRTVGLSEARTLASLLGSSTEQMVAPPESWQELVDAVKAGESLHESLWTAAEAIESAWMFATYARHELPKLEGSKLLDSLPPEMIGRVQRARLSSLSIRDNTLDAVFDEVKRRLHQKLDAEQPTFDDDEDTGDAPAP